MAEQGKDLPLVVAEILIEIHGINDHLEGVENRLEGFGNRLESVDNRLESVESRLENVENILLKVVDNVQHSSKAINRTAEIMLQQQQEFNRRFDQQRQETSFRFDQQQQENNRRFDQQQQQGDRIERAIVSLENRLESLENK